VHSILLTCGRINRRALAYSSLVQLLAAAMVASYEVIENVNEVSISDLLPCLTRQQFFYMDLCLLELYEPLSPQESCKRNEEL